MTTSRLFAILLITTILGVLLIGWINSSEQPNATSKTINEESERVVLETSSENDTENTDRKPELSNDEIVNKALLATDDIAEESCVKKQDTDPFSQGRSDEIKAFADDLRIRLDAAKADLLGSGLPEHDHVAALLSFSRSTRLAHLKKVVDREPDNTVALWHLFSECADARDSEHCPIEELEQRLIELDGQNSQTWMRIAVNRFWFDSKAAGLSALKRASTSAESSFFWGETLELMRAGALSTGRFSSQEEMLFALGSTMSYKPDLSTIADMCQEQSAKSFEWAEACLGYANITTSSGSYISTKQDAANIQFFALSNMGQTEKAAAIRESEETAKKAFGARLTALETSVELQDLKSLISSPDFVASVIEEFKTHGEWRGLDKIAGRIEQSVEKRLAAECQ